MSRIATGNTQQHDHSIYMLEREVKDLKERMRKIEDLALVTEKTISNFRALMKVQKELDDLRRMQNLEIGGHDE